MGYEKAPSADPAEAQMKDIALLRSIVDGTSHSTGDHFLRQLVRRVAQTIGVHNAFVSELLPGERIRTLAFWSNGKFVENIEYAFPGTPCEEVIHSSSCHIPSGVHKKYAPREPGVESYIGVALRSQSGKVLGHLCGFDEAPMPSDPRRLYIFQIFASRAGAELERLSIERELRISEDRFRDLFDEAPIAYVHEGLDSHFIRANRAARRILGITLEDVPHMVGKTMAPDTPDAQRRM